MYAIFSDGSHQHRVEEGMTLDVDLRDLPEGATSVEFDHVLVVGGMDGGPRIGQPTVPGAKVVASVHGEIKGDKLTIRKFRRRKGYSLKKGHRQQYLRVTVDRIEA